MREFQVIEIHRKPRGEACVSFQIGICSFVGEQPRGGDDGRTDYEGLENHVGEGFCNGFKQESLSAALYAEDGEPLEFAV